MTNEEIKKQIDENNELIEWLLTPSRFTLNNQINALLKQNESLQNRCTHNFIDGYCEYCYLEEKK